MLWLVAEFGAIWLGRKFKEEGDDVARGTFSWHIWFMRSKWYLRGVAFAWWMWAAYHFFFEPAQWLGSATDDIVLWLMLWGIGTLLIKPRNHIAEELGRQRDSLAGDDSEQ